MRVLPNTYLSGSIGNYNLFYFIRMDWVSGSSSGSIYHATLPTPSAVSMSYNGTPVTPATQFLPAFVANESGESTENVFDSIDFSIPIREGGGISSTGETSITFLNQSQFIQAYPYNFENQKIEIWEGFMPPSGNLEITTDTIANFKGAIREFTELDYSTIKFNCVDLRQYYNRMLPTVRMVEDTSANIPDINNGKCVPIFFGDFYYQNGEDITFGPKDAVPCLQIDKNRRYYIAAEHPLTDNVFSTYYIDQNGLRGTIISPVTNSFNYDGTNMYNVNLTDNKGRAGGAVRAQFTIQPKLYGTIAPGNANHLSETLGEWENTWEKAVDEVNGTYTTPTCSVNGAKFASYGFDFSAVPGSMISNTSSYAYTDINGPYDFSVNLLTSTLDLAGLPQLFAYRKSDAITFYAPTIITTGFESFNVKITDKVFTWEMLQDMEIGVTLVVSGTTVRMYNLYAQCQSFLGDVLSGPIATNTDVTLRTGIFGDIKFTLPLPTQKVFAPKNNWNSNIFVTTQGAPYLLQQISGSKAQYGNAIESSVYGIDWLLRQKVGLDDTVIDSASFHSAGNLVSGNRKDWIFATVLKEKKSVFDHISEICNNYCMFFVIEPSGKMKIVPMDSGSVVFTLDSSSVAYPGSPIVKVGQTNIDDIRNDFMLHYRRDYSKNEPIEICYVSDIFDTGSFQNNLVTASFAPDGSTYEQWLTKSKRYYGSYNKRVEAELTHVRKPVTAELSLKKIADWYAFKRLTIKAKILRNPTTMALELGDIIKVNLDILPSKHKNATQFMISRIAYPALNNAMENYIDIEAEEVPNANTGNVD